MKKSFVVLTVNYVPSVSAPTYTFYCKGKKDT